MFCLSENCGREVEDEMKQLCWMHKLRHRVKLKVFGRLTHIDKHIKKMEHTMLIMENRILERPTPDNYKRMELLVELMNVLRNKQKNR